MLEAYKFNTQGDVFIYAIRGEETILLQHVKNALQPLAQEIIANILAKTVGASSLNEIGLYIGSETPGGAIVRPIIAYTLIDVDRVQFDAIFEEASFSGTIVTAEISSSIGVFAKVQGLSLTKAPTEKILISWKIKII